MGGGIVHNIGVLSCNTMKTSFLGYIHSHSGMQELYNLHFFCHGLIMGNLESNPFLFYAGVSHLKVIGAYPKGSEGRIGLLVSGHVITQVHIKAM